MGQLCAAVTDWEAYFRQVKEELEAERDRLCQELDELEQESNINARN